LLQRHLNEVAKNREILATVLGHNAAGEFSKGIGSSARWLS